MSVTTITGLVGDFVAAAATVDMRADEVTGKFAEEIAVWQRALAPTGETLQTRDTISAERANVTTGVGWVAGTETWYAPFLEEGTSRMAPMPFIGPPADAKADAYTSAIGDIGADV